MKLCTTAYFNEQIWLRVVIVVGVSVYMDASSSHSVDVFWNRQGNTDKWPEIVCVLLFLRVLLAVHLFEALFGQHVHHVEHDGLLGALSGHDNSEPELGWDTEAEDTVDVGADDLEVHEGDEEFFVSILCSLMHGGATVFKSCFELSALLLVLVELLLAVVASSSWFLYTTIRWISFLSLSIMLSFFTESGMITPGILLAIFFWSSRSYSADIMAIAAFLKPSFLP